MSWPVLIAGGGIAGLSAARALAPRGPSVQVLERRHEFAEFGAGIQLAPNALAALQTLGVADAVLARASHVDALILRDGHDDSQLVRLPLGAAFLQRFALPYVVVHRADLYRPLLAACQDHPRIALATDSGVCSYLQHDHGVSVLLANGQRVQGAALLGADGLHSAIRQQMIGDGAPVLAGHTTYRALISASRVPPALRHNSVVLWGGPGFHFIQYPIAGGDAFNLVATCDNGASAPLAGSAVTAEQVAHQFPTIAAAPRTLIALAADWKSWTPCDRAPIARWHQGSVVLLGDAAHPMVQYAAQGACMALEDAMCLGELAGADWPALWARFSAQRQARAARVQLSARLMATQIYHPAGAQARQRNAMLAALDESALFDAVAWLYGGPHQADAGATGAAS